MSSRARATLGYAVLLMAAAGLALLVTAERITDAGLLGDDAHVEVTIREGTNFAVTASPDGRVLVVDLLGSLWVLSAQGGAATRITDELLEARQPSFSPRGDEIAFQGYLDDDWDIWSIKPDGSGAKRLTWGPADDREPHWSADGRYVAFSSDRTGNYDIWLLDVRGRSLRQLTTDPADDFSPAWSPDGREVAFASTRSPSGVWAVNIGDGAERLIAPVDGRASAPSWAPGGTQVMYHVLAGSAARLEISGKPVVAGEDVFPFRAHWLSDREFCYTADGRIRRRALAEPGAATVEFTAAVRLRRASYAKRRRDFDSRASRQALGIVRPRVSPDGDRVVFAALGDLWLMKIGGKPDRLTADRFIDTDPAWSPDGRRIVFSSDRAGTMDLWIREVPTGRERRLTQLPTAEMGGTWSPDGRRIAFVGTGPGYSVDLSVIDVETGEIDRIQQRIPTPTFPTWSSDGRAMLVGTVDRPSQRFGEGLGRLLLVPADGGRPQFLEAPPHLSSVDSRVDEGPVWSPDGTRLAFVSGGLLQVLDVDAAGAPIGPVRRLTNDLAHAPSWTADSRQILYLATDQLKRLSVEGGRVERVPLDLPWQPRMPEGRLVVHAGRLWNGRDHTPQVNHDIVIDGHRIRAIEPHRSALHSADVIDASGSTVMPGLIDMHVHVYHDYGEAQGRLLLAYGITTVRDPAATPYRSLEHREAIEAGVRIGPRLYTSGYSLEGSRTHTFPQFYVVRSPAQLDLQIEASRRLGHDMFKTYIRLPDVLQARVVEFAHQAGMSVTSHEIYPAAALGVDGVEHLGGASRRGYSPKLSALGNTYGDVVDLLARSGMSLTPTLGLDAAGFPLLALDDPSLLTDERLRALAPAWVVESARARVERLREAGPADRAQSLARQGRTLLTLTQAGVRVVAGTDAPNIPAGASLHAELELFVRGGLTPFDALQTATINAAEALGAGADLGSLEPGKLADLVIVEGDPLSDIRHARRVLTVIKNGEAFDRQGLLSGSAGRRRPVNDR